MNIANKLTMARVVMIPVFLAMLYIGFRGAQYAACAVFVLAGITDFADGHIARRRGLVTDFGKFMDPLADKALVAAAMLWFVECGVLPAWCALLVIVREFAVTALRLIAAGNGRVIAAARSGKIKTASTMACLTLMFFPLPSWLVQTFTWIIAVTTAVSGAEYFYKNRYVIALDK
jgi:CDP-diacylglycerol--glycerol-3-phosphate 3-phosphatidyltransferase